MYILVTLLFLRIENADVGQRLHLLLGDQVGRVRAHDVLFRLPSSLLEGGNFGWLTTY